jgi:outer membrane protein assembly factor BamB
VEGTLKWKFKTGAIVISSPIVKDDIVYFGSNDGNVYGLNVNTGTQTWKLKVGDKAYGSPSISNNLIYVASEARNGSNLSTFTAIDAVTGLKKWEISGVSMYGDSRVRKNIIVYGNGNKLLSSDAITGNSIWSFLAQRLTPFTNPIINNDIVFASSDSLYAFSLESGSRKWSYSAGLLSGLSPVASDSMIFHAYGPGVLAAIRSSDGSEKWQISINGKFNTNPTLAGETIYIGSSDYNLYAINAFTGATKWKLKTGNEITSSACVVLNTGEAFHSSESGY